MSTNSGIKPPILSDGTSVYKKFAEEYITHEKGFFILAPSGSGKTHFVKNQAEKHWIDGDILWEMAGATPKGVPWWTMGIDVISEVDMRSDLITMYAKKQGLWIIGASQYWLRPDAIYIPDWDTHRQYIKNREMNNYDGGATSDDFDQVLGHIKYMRDLAEKEHIPIFMTIEEAVAHLTAA